MERVWSSHVNTLEQWSPTLFLAGGVVLIAYAASLAVTGLMEISTPRNAFSGAGFTLVFLGLFGLCSGLADRRPRLARFGGVFAVLGALGFTLLFLLGIMEYVAITPPTWVQAALLLNNIPIVLGFLLVGIASLLTDSHPWSLGVLLFVPAVVFAVNVARVAVLGPWTPLWAAVLLGSLQALAMLTIGYSIRAESVQVARAE